VVRGIKNAYKLSFSDFQDDVMIIVLLYNISNILRNVRLSAGPGFGLRVLEDSF